MKGILLLCIAYILISSSFSQYEEFPPSFTEYPSSPTVDEGNYIDNPKFLFNLTATVRSPNLHVTISVEAPSSDIVYVNYTQIANKAYGQVYVKAQLDRERVPTEQLSFTARSSKITAPPTTLSVTLYIRDINDERPVFSPPAYHVFIPENYSVNTRVQSLKILAMDPDMGLGGQVNYSIEPTGQAEELYKGYFTIVTENDGAYLILSKELDYETLTFLQYKIIATDGGNPRLNSTADLLITILDVQDTPPVFMGLPLMVSVQEEIPMEYLITKAFAVDGDLGIPNNISYSLEAGECASFVRINAVSGGLYAQKILDRDSGLLNRKNGLCSITVKASKITDSPSNVSQSTGVLTLSVQDINDNAPIFDKTVYQGYVQEGMTDIDITIPRGILLSDADQGNNSIMDLTVYHGEGRTRFFGIEASPSAVYSSGTVHLRLVNNFTIDYKAMTMFDLYVKAEDRGLPKQSSSCRVTVYVNETNRFYPQFIHQGSSTLDFSIFENTKFGTLVANVQAYDMDSGNYGQIQYTLTGSDNSFSINSRTGGISVACNNSCLDRERQRVYYMTVEARDGGGKMSPAPVKITLIDVNDNSPMFLQPKYVFGITENSSLISGMDSFSVHAVDLDEPHTANSLITYTLLTRPDTLDKHFAISSATGSIRIVNPLTRDELSSIPDGRLGLAVTAQDHGSPSLTATVSVTAFLQAQFHSATSCNCGNTGSTTPAPPAHHGNTYSGQSLVLCQGQTGYIQCEAGQLIRILSAVYGRTTDDICPSHDLGSLRCQSHSSTDHIKWSCNGYRHCRLFADNSVFGEPCIGIDKYLEVSFHCVDQSDILGVCG